MEVSRTKVINEVTSHSLFVLLRKTIDTSGSLIVTIVITHHITINHIIIITNNGDVYIVRPKNS
jgi:hypothetical protein